MKRTWNVQLMKNVHGMYIEVYKYIVQCTLYFIVHYTYNLHSMYIVCTWYALHARNTERLTRLYKKLSRNTSSQTDMNYLSVPADDRTVFANQYEATH